LHTGDVIGEDPLLPYTSSVNSTVEMRAEQVRRLADFPHAGDLIVNSPIYPDGTVAAYEELIGNHGGLGGEQTDAFILCPGEIQVPETRNSTEVYSILNARRGIIPQVEQSRVTGEVSPWDLSTLVNGISKVKVWLVRAMQVLVFEREAYREVASDVYMTGPALLISILIEGLATLAVKENWLHMASRWGIWLLVSVLLWLSGRSMGSKEDFTPLLRTFGFAQVCRVWLLLRLIPQFAPLANLISLSVWLLAIWLSANAALKLKGWRTFLLPLVTILLYVVGVWSLGLFFRGTILTLWSLLENFGLR
jgi:hypothetical protein